MVNRRRVSVLSWVGGALCLVLLTSFAAAASPAGPPDTGPGVQPQVMQPRAFMPLVNIGWFVPRIYQDGFENVNSGWPWGSGDFDYGYKTDPDGAKVYHVRMDGQEDIVFVTGPAKTMGEYEYRAIMRRATTEQPRQWGDEYGLLLSPTPIDPKNRAGSGVYTFAVELRIGSGIDTYYSVSKWSNLANKSRTILKRAGESTYLTAGAKLWNQLKIERSGDTLSFYVSRQDGGGFLPWIKVFEYTDPSLPDVMYIGFYAKHAEGAFEDYVVEFQFDTLYLSTHP